MDMVHTAGHSSVEDRALRDFGVFDGASRGSQGSLKLLWTMKGWQVACIGAVLTLLALAFDTFSQQVLSVQFKNVLDETDSALSSFTRNERYGREHDTKGPTGAFQGEVDLPMNAAIANGILATDIANLPVPCSTGNCSWPIIPSLGVCGGCTNVTSNVTSSCPGPFSTHAANCTWSLPSGTSSISYPLSHDYPRKSFRVVNSTTGDVYGGKSCNVSIDTDPYEQSTTQCSNLAPDVKVSETPYNIANFEAIMIPWDPDNTGFSVANTTGPKEDLVATSRSASA